MLEALPNHLPERKTLRVVYSNPKVSVNTALMSSVGPLLELCLAQTNSHGAYVYRLDGESGVLELLAWRGSRPSDIPAYSVELDRKVSQWYSELSSNIAL